MRISRIAVATIFALGACFAGTVSAQERINAFPTMRLQSGMFIFNVEVAGTAAAREQGLMYRKSLALNSGMLFDFERSATKVCMWMKNTDIPLSVAFMDAEGEILNIEDMQPQTLDNHCSAEGKEVRYALEMDLGWFKQKHIGVGNRIIKAGSAG